MYACVTAMTQKRYSHGMPGEQVCTGVRSFGLPSVWPAAALELALEQ